MSKIVSSGIITRKDEVKTTRDNIRQKLAEAYEKDHEMIEGEFISHEPGKNAFDFRFKKWKQDDYVQYSLMHRTKYVLPRMVVRHINNNIHHVTYKEIPQPGGFSHKPANSSTDGIFVATENMKMQIKIPRCEFRPTSLDPDDTDINQPRLVDVSMHM